MKLEIKPLGRNSEILVQEIVGELMIYDLRINKAYLLNQTSALIWKLCDGTISVHQIAEAASKKLDSKISEDFVWLALEQYKKDNLLEDNTINNPLFNKLPRREVIKKIGLSTMAVLPFISSIIVPSSAEGASCLSDGINCSSPQQCCNNCCFFDSSLGVVCVTARGICPDTL